MSTVESGPERVDVHKSDEETRANEKCTVSPGEARKREPCNSSDKP